MVDELLVVWLPELVSSVTVNALVAEEDAVALMAVEVMTSLFAVAARMVSVWVPEVRGVDEAVILGVPVLLSP